MAGGSLWNNVKSRERELWLETYDPPQCTLITYFRIWAFFNKYFACTKCYTYSLPNQIPNCFHNISRKPMFITFYCTSEGLLNPRWSVNFNYLQMLYLTIPLKYFESKCKNKSAKCAISWHFDLSVCMPAHTMRLIVTLSNYSENPACCQFKVVGGETYRLIHADHGEQTMDVYGCKDDCIYRK